MGSIYCKDCKELTERKYGPYCLEYKETLRAVPMSLESGRFAVRCLKCMEKRPKKG